ncbi:MAG: nucleoside-diphosphate sugar epimerase/dehydratase, partial [Anaerolineaceae bacterium]
SLMLIELYDTRKANRHSEVLRGVGTSAGFSVVIYLLIFFLAQTNSLPRRGVAVFLISVTLLTIIWRFIYIAIFSAPVFNRRVLVIGAGRAGSTLVGMVKRIKPEPFELVGYIDDDPQKQNQVIEGVPVIGTTETLLNLIEKEKISDMIFAISGDLKPDLFRAVLLAQEEGTDLISMPTIYEDVFGRVPIFLLQSDWILRS